MRCCKDRKARILSTCAILWSSACHYVCVSPFRAATEVSSVLQRDRRGFFSFGPLVFAFGDASSLPSLGCNPCSSQDEGFFHLPVCSYSRQMSRSDFLFSGHSLWRWPSPHYSSAKLRAVNPDVPKCLITEIILSPSSAVLAWLRPLWLPYLWAAQGGSWWKDFPIRWRNEGGGTWVATHAAKGFFSTRNPGIAEALEDTHWIQRGLCWKMTKLYRNYLH
jgi:hypothetical protein